MRPVAHVSDWGGHGPGLTGQSRLTKPSKLPVPCGSYSAPNLLFCDAEPRLKWEFAEPLILGREACPDTNDMAELTIAAAV